MAPFRKETRADKRQQQNSLRSEMTPHSKVSNLSAGRIAIGYAVLAIVWIAFSDALVTHLKLPPMVMTIKGTVFVFVTALLLFLTIRQLAQAIQLTSLHRRVARRPYLGDEQCTRPRRNFPCRFTDCSRRRSGCRRLIMKSIECWDSGGLFKMIAEAVRKSLLNNKLPA